MTLSQRITAKADAYLTQGRVAIVRLSPTEALCRVAGSAPEPYTVAFLGRWACSCPAQVENCAHIVACQKITRLEPARQVLFTDDSDDSHFLQEALKGPR